MLNRNIQRICGTDVTVTEADPAIWATSGMGRGDAKQATILICKGMPDDVKKATLIHEVIHIILDMNGFSEETNNEKMVCVLSNGLYAWMKDTDILKG